jgi:hypothetical protein
MEAYGCGCIDLGFLDLGTSWRWVVSFTQRPLYPWGRSHWHPLDRSLGGSQNLSGWCRENSLPYGDSNSDFFVAQPITSCHTNCVVWKGMRYNEAVVAHHGVLHSKLFCCLCSSFMNPYRLCGLVVKSSWLQIERPRVRFPALPDFLRSSGSRSGSTYSREYNWGTTWKK